MAFSLTPERDPRDEPTPRDWLVDAALAFGLTALTCLPHALIAWSSIPVPVRYGHPLAVLLSGVLFAAPLALRRHAPLLMIVLVTMAGLVQLSVSALPMLTVVLAPLYVYSGARWIPGWESRVAVSAGLAGAVLGPARWLFTLNPLSSPLLAEYLLAVVMCAGAVLTPYSIGRRARENAVFEQTELDRAREHYEMLLQQQQQRARMAEVNARNEIARELHDVVAHSLSVIIVQAQGGQALATKRPEAAAEVLETIAETGREALTDMRRIVGVLRRDPGSDAAAYLPAPGLGDIAELVAKSGARAELSISGEAPAVSSTVALTAYRIIQEALTNVLKHAGPDAHAMVEVRYDPRQISIEVRDDGLGAAAPNDGSGNGLRGMAERVAAMGGTLQARPGPDGFVVEATLPADATPTRAPVRMDA